MTVIHQTLHGYAEGHRLLASSRRLASTSQRTMRTLTDLSGPRLIPGFEDYLSGYSLLDDRLFVFSRTWYADEAERPGCVWTHSLLLNEDVLRNTPNLLSLTEYFRRPEGGGDFSSYEKEILATPLTVKGASQLSRSFVAKVITALYGNPAPVVLPAYDSTTLTALHLELWQHYYGLTGQWLQFCTGAIQLRQSPTGAFDLQTVPMQSVRDIVRSANDAQVVTEAEGQAANWAEAFAADVGDQRSRDFADFLASYGSFPVDGRASIRPYSILFRSLMSDDHDLRLLVAVVRQLQDLFSEKHQAVRLKVAVASGPSYRHFFRDVADGDVLSTVVREDEHNSFDAATLDVPNRLVTAWKVAPKDAIELVRAALKQQNDISHLIVSTFADSLRPTDVAALIEWASDLMPVFVASSPCLLASPAIWRSPDVVRESALEAFLHHTTAPDDVLFAVVGSQLDSGIRDVARRMISTFGIETVDAVLSWAVANKWQPVPEDWQAGIEELGDDLAKWLTTKLEGNVPEILTLPRVLSPSSRVARLISYGIWVGAVERAATANMEGQESSLCLFVLKLGLERSDSGGEEMVSTSFPRVYVAASQNALDDRLWKVIEGSFNTWWWGDRCRTLRTGLVNNFAAKHWSQQRFVRALPTPHVLWEILSAWGWDRKEKKFLGAVIQHLLSTPTHAVDSGFHDVAAKCAHWFDIDVR